MSDTLAHPRIPCLLTIVTPVYNGERFISFCIENVISQNCEHIRHIIVDGGSKDRTVEIIRDYASRYPHLSYISEPDRGQSDALNKGIRLAPSDYVGLLNVDDYYEPGTLNRVVGLISTFREPHFIAGNCRVLDDEGNEKYLNTPSNLDIECLSIGDSFYQYPHNPVAYFYHKGVHDRVGYYDLGEEYAMDVKFVLAAVQNLRVAYFDEVWGNYRYLKGTKTFEDQMRGTSEARKRKVYLANFMQLSLKRKINVAGRFVLYHSERKLRRLRLQMTVRSS